MRLLSGIELTPIVTSQVGPTTEFTVILDDGSSWRAAPSFGESVGIYEDQSTTGKATTVLGGTALHDLLTAEAVGKEWDQASWDAWLTSEFERIGRNNASALSEAFWYAAEPRLEIADPRMPYLVLNIVNGGEHAYTNPVLSDFQEYCLVARDREPFAVLGAFNEIMAKVRERLAGLDRTVINGNPVHRLGAADNRAVLDLLSGVLADTGHTDDFSIYIDAAAGDLRDENGYQFSVTDDSRRTPEELVDYWSGLIGEYPVIDWLEDPLGETDFDGWAALTSAVGDRCRIVGDNFYSTDAERIASGTEAGWANGVIIKPNQAGTVSATRAAIAAAKAGGQAPVTSHRSVSTESVLVSRITVAEHVDHIKIGPMATDYSSVQRLNELIRLQRES